MVSIISVNFNQTALTCALLESIRQQEFQDIEVIVVDNASAENPEAALLECYPGLIFIRNNHNLGFAGANNRACAAATGNQLFFVNNDAEVTPGCIARLLQFLHQNPTAGIVSPLICYHSSQSASVPIIQYAGMPRVNPYTSRSNMDGNGAKNLGQYSQAFPTGYAHGAAMMINRALLESIGPMAEDYFLYYEEVDWCERMHRAGLGVWVEPGALVWHKESATVNTLGPVKSFYLARNRIKFMKRHYPGYQFLVFSLFMIFVSAPKQAIILLSKGAWGDFKAFLAGIVAGFRTT